MVKRKSATVHLRANCEKVRAGFFFGDTFANIGISAARVAVLAVAIAEDKAMGVVIAIVTPKTADLCDSSATPETNSAEDRFGTDAGASHG